MLTAFKNIFKRKGSLAEEIFNSMEKADLLVSSSKPDPGKLNQVIKDLQGLEQRYSNITDKILKEKFQASLSDKLRGGAETVEQGLTRYINACQNRLKQLQPASKTTPKV